MSALVRLYPKAWRDRYAEEFLDVLADRPPSLADRLDILLGAIDAHLQPEVPHQDGADAGQGTAVPIAGLTAILTGLLWIGTALLFLTAPFGADGNKETTSGMLTTLAAGIVSGLTTLGIAGGLPRHGRLARYTGIAMLVGAALLFAPWPILALGVYLLFLTTIALGGLLVANRASLVGSAMAVTGLLAFGVNTETVMAVCLVPLGLVWMGLGAQRIVSGRWVPAADPSR